MATLTPEERGSFLHFDDEYSKSPVPPEARQHQSFECALYNNFWYRASTPSTHPIYTAIRKPNKGNLLHEIPNVFGSASYYHHDKLSVGFRLLAEQANALRKEICLITVTFNDETNIKLRKLDADDSKNTTMAERVSEWLRVLDKKGINKDAISVLEECSNSSLVINGETFKRLHVHILMVLSESEQEMVKKTLFRRRLHKHTYVDVATTWVSKWKHSLSEQIEEDQFGPIPQDKVDPNAEYWLNTYVKEVEYFGKKVKMVHRVLPVCMRAADYLSKSLGTPIGKKGRNYSFRGLEGREALHIELAKQYAAVKQIREGKLAFYSSRLEESLTNRSPRKNELWFRQCLLSLTHLGTPLYLASKRNTERSGMRVLSKTSLHHPYHVPWKPPDCFLPLGQ